MTLAATSMQTAMQRPAPADGGLRQATRGPLRLGLLLILVFFGGLVGSSHFIILASAAVAPGVVSPEGRRKTIQHLEGGIIRDILVKDGDVVAEGDPLIVLEDTNASAAYQQWLGQSINFQALLARLRAEQADAATLEFPDELVRLTAEAGESEVLETQRALFEARRRSHRESRAILTQREAQIENQIVGLVAEIDSLTRQSELLTQEVAGVRELVDKGLERRPRLLSLERELARLDGERASNTAAIARAREAIGETRLQLINLDTTRINEIVQAISENQAQLATVSERLRASEFVLSRTVIRSPLAGTVVQLRHHTIGGVIGAGEPILDLVPAGEELIVQAQVSPNDIDVVHQGLEARVHFSAFKQRNLPQIHGHVRKVSADSITDQATRASYYLAEVVVPLESIQKLDRNLVLAPGMQAEVMIVTGERSLLSYITDPFRDISRRGLVEE